MRAARSDMRLRGDLIADGQTAIAHNVIWQFTAYEIEILLSAY